MKKYFKSFQIFMMCQFLTSAMNMEDLNQISANDLTPHLITSEGYPILEYSVTTSDGYILKIFRIPGSAEKPKVPGKPVIFLMHGFLNSSKDWIVLGKRSLPYLLADAGFDVFLGNARGNTYSRKHVKISPSNTQFWKFTWHHMGAYDLPASIDFILALTNQKNLHYIGFSQGTTAFFVAASLYPDLNDKIRTMHALAPVVFMTSMKSPVIRALSHINHQLELFLKVTGKYEVLPQSSLGSKIARSSCKKGSIFQELCVNLLFLTCGYDSELLNRTLLPLALKDSPAGASYLQLSHYTQNKKTGKFKQFDYGMMENLSKYGSIRPPEYDLQAVKSPVYLHYSSNDWMADVADVQTLSEKLGNLVDTFRIPHAKFNHLDFIYGIDVDKLVYKNLVNIITRDDKYFA